MLLQTEIEAIRDDIAPTWLQQPLSLEQTADKFLRPSLQQVRIACPHSITNFMLSGLVLPAEPACSLLAGLPVKEHHQILWCISP